MCPDYPKRGFPLGCTWETLRDWLAGRNEMMWGFRMWPGEAVVMSIGRLVKPFDSLCWTAIGTLCKAAFSVRIIWKPLLCARKFFCSYACSLLQLRKSEARASELMGIKCTVWQLPMHCLTPVYSVDRRWVIWTHFIPARKSVAADWYAKQSLF